MNCENVLEEKNETTYTPQFLSWCKNYEQEEIEMRKLILSHSADIKQLKKEYSILTGKRFRRKKHE